MSKHVVLCLVLACLVLSPCYSTKTEMRQIDVKGYLGPSHSVNVTPIYGADDGSGTEGMPVDLMKDDIRTSGGRRIATWTLSSNYLPLKVLVEADDLSLGEYKIPYVLRFAYEYPVYNDDSQVNNDSQVSYRAGSSLIGSDGLLDNGYGDTIYFSEEEDLQGVNMINSPDCYISFILPDDVFNSLQDGSLEVPDGEYSANVRITISGGA